MINDHWRGTAVLQGLKGYEEFAKLAPAYRDGVSLDRAKASVAIGWMRGVDILPYVL